MTAAKETTPARPVLTAIAKIMGEVGAVEKRGENKFHGYKYAAAADIAHALQKRMAEAGLLIIPYQGEMKLLAEDSIMAIDFAFEVTHISGDKLEERPVFTGMSACRNSKGGFDDKAANKCLTAAAKYFVLNLFRIPTGDYHDADAAEDTDKPAAPKPAAKAANGGAPLSITLPSAPGLIPVPAPQNNDMAGVWRAWGEAFARATDGAQTVEECNAWLEANRAPLVNLAGFSQAGKKWATALHDRMDKRRAAVYQAPLDDSDKGSLEHALDDEIPFR